MPLLFLLFALLSLFACTSEPQPNADVPRADSSKTVVIVNDQQLDSIDAIFIGTWINEGELSNLQVEASNTCLVRYFDQEEGEVAIKGTCEQQGEDLVIRWEKPFFGQAESSYFYKKTDSQKLLMQRFEDNREHVAFYREE